MMLGRTKLSSCVAATLLLIISAISSTPASASSGPAPVGPHVQQTLWGGYVGNPYGPTVPNPPPCSGTCEINQLESAAGGKHVGVVIWYEQWANNGCGTGYTYGCGDFNYVRDTGQFETVHSRGAIPEISWMSVNTANSADTTLSDSAIAGGSHDAYIDQWAQGLRSLGYPIFLRLDFEMNGNWASWAPGQNGNTAATFVAMWKHVHDRFTAAGATNVQWIWSPNIEDPSYNGGSNPGSWQTATYGSLYPGDAYVDWTGVDGYNKGGVQGNSWQTFDQVFTPSYRDLLALAPTKPVMIAETSSVEAPSTVSGQCPVDTSATPPHSKGAWFADALLRALPTSFPAVRAIVFFDQDNGGAENYRVDSTPCAQAGFAAGINSPYYADGQPIGV